MFARFDGAPSGKGARPRSKQCRASFSSRTPPKTTIYEDANLKLSLPVAGRRMGKTALIVVLAIDYTLSGRNVAVFAPTYRLLKPIVDEIVRALGHLPNIEINRSLGMVRLPGGGSVDFWSLDHSGRAARGRKYHLALCDEAAHSDYLADTLEAAIMPSLLDYGGKLTLASTPAGLEGPFCEAANMPEKNYAVFHAPTSANPFLSTDEIALLRAGMNPLIASQELDALFVDISGASMFQLNLLLMDGQPVEESTYSYVAIGLAIDSNSGKGGEGRDGRRRGDLRRCVSPRHLPVARRWHDHHSGLGHQVFGPGRDRAVDRAHERPRPPVGLPAQAGARFCWSRMSNPLATACQ